MDHRRKRRQIAFCCRNCKSRRIRCDGKQPNCGNCISKKLECGGYSSWKVPLDHIVVSTSPEDLRTASTVTGTSFLRLNGPVAVPPAPLHKNFEVDDVARHGFDFFRQQVWAKYAQRGYPISWATTSIAVGSTEPSVFYAMAALGIAEQGFNRTLHSSLTRPMDGAIRSKALHLYLKAIQHLREPMQKAVAHDGPLEPIILSCLLFLVYEVTAGNTLNAIRHARTGKNILDERLHRNTLVDHSQPYHTVLSATNEERQVGKCRHPDCPMQLPLRAASFTSIEEARSRLELLIDKGQQFREDVLQRAASHAMLLELDMGTNDSRRFCLQHTLSRFISIGTAQKRFTKLIDSFASWSRQFDLMFTSGTFMSRDLFYLQVRYFHAYFTLAMSRATTEKSADGFADQFVRTLDSVERILRDRTPSVQCLSQESAAGPVADHFMQKLGFASESSLGPTMGPLTTQDKVEERAAGAFELGVLHSLYAIACRCRTSSIRLRATNLLANAQRSEVFVSSTSLAEYARAVIGLEEQLAAQLGDETGCQQLDCYADEVPEAARFLDVVASPGSADGNEACVLNCTRRTSRHTQLELWEYRLDGGSGAGQCVSSFDLQEIE